MFALSRSLRETWHEETCYVLSVSLLVASFLFSSPTVKPTSRHFRFYFGPGGWKSKPCFERRPTSGPSEAWSIANGAFGIPRMDGCTPSRDCGPSNLREWTGSPFASVPSSWGICAELLSGHSRRCSPLWYEKTPSGHPVSFYLPACDCSQPGRPLPLVRNGSGGGSSCAPQ